MEEKKRILLTGGGTGGSVAPLLAIIDEFRSNGLIDKYEFYWIGTKNGPERLMVEEKGIEFNYIPSGKWRRYFSFKNVLDIFRIICGFCVSFKFLFKLKPDLIITAGSFVSVPIVWVGWLFKIPVLVHQQDIKAGLANKMMSPFAKVISVTFKQSLDDFGSKAVWIGNPVRNEIRYMENSAKSIFEEFNLDEQKPVVFIMGGGTGAEGINKLTVKSLDKLTKFCQVFHITGKKKGINFEDLNFANYNHFPFLPINKFAKILQISDVVVSRCGLSALTELSYSRKPCILIPMPNSHQEDNAKVFAEYEAVLKFPTRIDVNYFKPKQTIS